MAEIVNDTDRGDGVNRLWVVFPVIWDVEQSGTQLIYVIRS